MIHIMLVSSHVIPSPRIVFLVGIIRGQKSACGLHALDLRGPNLVSSSAFESVQVQLTTGFP